MKQTNNCTLMSFEKEHIHPGLDSNLSRYCCIQQKCPKSTDPVTNKVLSFPLWFDFFSIPQMTHIFLFKPNRLSLLAWNWWCRCAAGVFYLSSREKLWKRVLLQTCPLTCHPHSFNRGVIHCYKSHGSLNRAPETPLPFLIRVVSLHLYSVCKINGTGSSAQVDIWL